MRVSSRGLVAACLLAAACSGRPLVPLADPKEMDPRATPAMTTAIATPSSGSVHEVRSAQREVDLLFVIDDSGSMAPKQWSMRQRFPALLDKLRAQPGLGYDLHIGVTNTDLGAPGTSCGWMPGGQLLRIGAWPEVGCRALEREPYLTLNTATGATNAPTGQDAATTFGCMAAVGEGGCGFEMPLESAYRTLNEPDPSGFLRADALLVLVFVTDEDDCSVDDPASDLFTSPARGAMNSFRCARYGVVCDGALLPDAPHGPFASCRPATAAEGGALAPIEKYRRFFTGSLAEGGLKADPSRVVIASLAGSASLVAVTEGHGIAECGVDSETCSVLAHSCGNATRFADPAVRLASLVGSSGRRVERSICDDDFSGFFESLATEIGQ